MGPAAMRIDSVVPALCRKIRSRYCSASMSPVRKKKVTHDYGRIGCMAGSTRASYCRMWVHWYHVVGSIRGEG